MNSFEGPLSYLSAVFLLLFAAQTVAETRAIGVPRFSKDLKILDESEVASQFLRSVLMRTLVKANRSADGSMSYDLDVATGFSTDGKFSKVTFFLPEKPVFADGSPLEFGDLQFSLVRCRGAGRFQNVGELLKKERLKGGIKVRVAEVMLREGGVPEYTKVLEDFSTCPLIQERSSRLFGSQLGKGNAIIPSGRFKISAFKAGSEYTLTRWDEPDREPREILVQSFSESDQALSLLRSGSLDAFVGGDAESLEKARNDETLKVVKCPQGMIVYRQGLSFRCDPRLALDSLIYTDVPS